MRLTVGVLGGITRGRDVMSNGGDFLSTTPDGTTGVSDTFGLAVEMNVVGDVVARNLPCVGIVEPWIGTIDMSR